MAESETVATLRSAYAAFNRGEADTFLHLLADEVELRPSPQSLEPETRVGREAMREYLAPNLFAEQRAEPEEFVEDGDRVLVVVQVRARGANSGIELQDRVFHLWTIENARAVRLEIHASREPALAALRG